MNHRLRWLTWRVVTGSSAAIAFALSLTPALKHVGEVDLYSGHIRTFVTLFGMRASTYDYEETFMPQPTDASGQVLHAWKRTGSTEGIWGTRGLFHSRHSGYNSTLRLLWQICEMLEIPESDYFQMRCFLVEPMLAGEVVSLAFDGGDPVSRIWCTINDRESIDLWTRDGGLSENARNACNSKVVGE